MRSVLTRKAIRIRVAQHPPPPRGALERGRYAPPHTYYDLIYQCNCQTLLHMHNYAGVHVWSALLTCMPPAQPMPSHPLPDGNASFNRICNRQQPPPTALATCSSRPSNRFWSPL